MHVSGACVFPKEFQHRERMLVLKHKTLKKVNIHVGFLMAFFLSAISHVQGTSSEHLLQPK